MSHGLQNETIGLGFAENSYDIFIHILEADDTTRPVFLRLQKQIQWIICGIAWLLIVIGSYFRCILYRYLYEQYKVKGLTPINTLILVTCIIQQVNIVNFVTAFTLIVANDTSLEYIGLWYCNISKWFFLFELYYACISGLGISIYRMLYIKKENWLKYDIGEKTVLKVILFGGLILAALFVLAASINEYDHILRETCMHVPRRLILELLDEYEQSRGNTSIYLYWRNIRMIVALLTISMIIAEIVLYSVFFHHLYRHDNSENLRHMLDASIIKHRNRRNAITFFAQFCSFVFEFMFLIAAILAVLGKSRWYVGFVLKVSCFTTMSIVEVLTSSALRPRVLKKRNSN